MPLKALGASIYLSIFHLIMNPKPVSGSQCNIKNNNNNNLITFSIACMFTGLSLKKVF